MKRSRSSKVAASFVLVALGAALVTLAWSGTGPDEQPEGLDVASSGSVSITNSKDGKAVLSAGNLAPGEETAGTVSIGNAGDVPMRVRVSGKIVEPGGLDSDLRLRLFGPGGQRLYGGPPGDLRRWLGVLQPDQRRRYRLAAVLPVGSGNDLQGQSTSVDLVWQGKPAAPPEECKVRALRSRFFIFKRRHRVRMVVRYRSLAPAAVSLVFYERLRGDRRGPRVGGFRTRMGASEDHWTLNRIARRRSTPVLDGLRRSRRGFIVKVLVHGAPGYCARRMNLVLTELRRVDRQFVWFQRGSFRRIR